PEPRSLLLNSRDWEYVCRVKSSSYAKHVDRMSKSSANPWRSRFLLRHVDRRRTASQSGRIADHHADRGWIETVARIVHLGAVGDHKQHVHVRGHVDIIARRRNAVDNREVSGRID